MNVQITEEEKFEMYMKLTKKELARLLVEKDNLINMAMQPSFPIYPTYPIPAYPSEPIGPYYYGVGVTLTNENNNDAVSN